MENAMANAQVFHGKSDVFIALIPLMLYYIYIYIYIYYVYCILKDVLNVTVPSKSLAVRNQKLMRS